MPRMKKLPKIDYEGPGRSSDPQVSKSNPLQTLSKTDLTLPELKILDVYLSRINPHDPDKRTVELEKGELEKYLGVSRILKPDLDKRLLHLFQVVEVEDKTKKRGFKLISLFEEIYAERDDNGLWKVLLTCTQSAREYIFNIDTIGYLRYRLGNIINLKSRYSYQLYLHIEKNRFRGPWETALDELKTILNCKSEAYKQFYRFNDLVLKKCQKEIIEKTDCKFTYEPVKKGRTVIAIRFSAESRREITENPDTIPGQITIEDLMQPSESETQLPDHLQLLDSATEKIFSQEELETIWQAVANVPESDLPDNPYGIEIRRYHYVSEKVALMKLYDSKNPIKNKHKYLLKMIHEKEG